MRAGNDPAVVNHCFRRRCEQFRRPHMLRVIVQFLHVASGIVWVGSGVGLVGLMAVMTRSGDSATLAATGRHMEVLGPRLFGPSAIATLLFGVITVLVGDISFT